jgi:hypothetical protein
LIYKEYPIKPPNVQELKNEEEEKEEEEEEEDKLLIKNIEHTGGW